MATSPAWSPDLDDAAQSPAPPRTVDADAAVLRAWLDAARRGDGAALQSLCAALRPRLYRAAYAILRDGAAADDVAQEALVRALLQRFASLVVRDVAAWTSRIALNLAKNAARDQRRRRELLERSPHDAPQPRAVDDGARVLLERERAAHVERALSTLPPRQQDVARLRLVGAASFAEIAAALSISEANARMAFSLAAKKLSAAFDEGPPPRAAPSTSSSRGDR